MKKNIVILFLLSVSFLLKAQTETGDSVTVLRPSTKVFGGMLFASSGSTSFTKTAKPFTLGYNVLPNIVVVYDKVFGNFMYSMSNNALKIGSGYIIGNVWDVYAAGYKCLDSRSKYFGAGGERKITAGEINIFLFTEFGFNLSPTSKLLTIGFHANLDALMVKR